MWLAIAKYKFLLRARDVLILPPYKGSTLRGGFGISFRQICCVNKKVKTCSNCTLKEKCAYAYIFETSPSRQTNRLKNLSEIPRPFVIEPPLEDKTVYRQGETLGFNLILIGKAIDYFPYFVFTFKELGNIGIGKNRGGYELYQICSSDNKKIYDSRDETIRNINSEISFDDYLITNFSNADSFSLSFTTPTRIKFRNDLVVKPEFHILIRSLLHRLSALSYFHCGEELKVDYNLLISQAEEIRIKESSLRWVDWERYSSRQDTRMKLGGFIGKVTYTGEFSPFLHPLFFGQYTHVGKNTTFGLGRYEIVNM